MPPLWLNTPTPEEPMSSLPAASDPPLRLYVPLCAEVVTQLKTVGHIVRAAGLAEKSVAGVPDEFFAPDQHAAARRQQHVAAGRAAHEKLQGIRRHAARDRNRPAIGDKGEIRTAGHADRAPESPRVPGPKRNVPREVCPTFARATAATIVKTAVTRSKQRFIIHLSVFLPSLCLGNLCPGNLCACNLCSANLASLTQAAIAPLGYHRNQRVPPVKHRGGGKRGREGHY